MTFLKVHFNKSNKEHQQQIKWSSGTAESAEEDHRTTVVDAVAKLQLGFIWAYTSAHTDHFARWRILLVIYSWSLTVASVQQKS